MPVHRQRVVSPEQVGQFFNGLAVSQRDCRQMFPQRLDGLLTACGRRKGDRQDLSAATVNGLLGICADACGELQKEDEDRGRSGSEYHGELRGSTAPASHRKLDCRLILYSSRDWDSTVEKFNLWIWRGRSKRSSLAQSDAASGLDLSRS